MHFDWQKIVGEASRAAEKEDGIVISNQVLQTTLDGLKGDQPGGSLRARYGRHHAGDDISGGRRVS